MKPSLEPLSIWSSPRTLTQATDRRAAGARSSPDLGAAAPAASPARIGFPLDLTQGLGLVRSVRSTLEDVADILERMRGFAERAIDPTLPPFEREALNDAFMDLMVEIDQISDAASYEGVWLLDGTGGIVPVRVVADGREGEVSVDLSRDYDAATLGVWMDIDTSENAMTAVGQVLAALESIAGSIAGFQELEDTFTAALAAHGGGSGGSVISELA